jgi:hypothetical protein
MGRFLVVAGGAPDSVRAVFDRGVVAFASITGARPHDVFEGPGVRVAAFPRAKGATPPIRRLRDGGFFVGAGAWWLDLRRADADPAAAERAAAATREGADPVEGLRPFDGSFAFATGGGGAAFAAVVDRVGSAHVYEAEVDGCRVVSGSALVLAAIAGASLDDDAVFEAIANGSVYGRRSLYRGVSKIPAATLVRYGAAGRSETTWFDLGSVGFHRARDSGGDEALAAALVDAVGATTRDPSGACVLDLTGGYDSRAILAAALKAGGSFRTVVNGPADDPDVVAAERIAATFGLRHATQRPGVEIPSRTFASVRAAVAATDGEFDALDYATVAAIHRRTAPHGELSVNGSSGELCRGYWWKETSDLRSPNGYDVRAAALARFTYDGTGEALLSKAARARASARERFEATIRATLADARLKDAPAAMQADAIYLLMRMQRWGGRIASATETVRPTATPFQFLSPLRAALATDPNLRRGGEMAPRVIERLNPKLAALPLAEGYPALPFRLGTAAKFWPKLPTLATKAARRLRRRFFGGFESDGPSVVQDVWSWPEAKAVLGDGAMETAGFFDPEALAAFLAASRRRGFAAGRTFGRVLTLELAARLVLEARGGA